MSEPTPVRVTEVEEVERPDEVIRRARVTEYASALPVASTPPPAPAKELPHAYSPECCNAALRDSSVLRYRGPVAPPPVKRPWWKGWFG